MQSAADLILRLQELNLALAELNELQQLTENELVELLEAQGERSASVTIRDGQQLNATVVRPERTVIDEQRLAKALGWHFNEVADLKLNRAKLEQAIQEGKISFKDVAKYTTIKDTKPYLRWSVVQTEVEDE